MADQAISVTTLTAGAVSADVLTNGEGGTTITAGNTAVIDVQNDTRNVIITLKNTSASTATAQAGDNPAALRAGLGSTGALSIPAGDCLLMVLEGARHMHDDGKIRIDIASNDTILGAYRLPKTI